MKKIYERAVFSVFLLTTKDIISTSGWNNDDHKVPIVLPEDVLG
jgi:hypothetical protein